MVLLSVEGIVYAANNMQFPPKATTNSTHIHSTHTHPHNVAEYKPVHTCSSPCGAFWPKGSRWKV